MDIKNANKILVIDDDTVILDFLIELLQDEISVSYTSEGAQAVELGRLHKPDLILLDVMMPDIDGFEVCRRLKADPQTQHVPVVFLTSKKDESDIAKGLELGALDYITKPFDPELVVAKIRNILKQITATRAAAKPNERDGFVEGETRDRRAEGNRRPDRTPKVAPDGAMERRSRGAARPDRYEKSADKPQSMTLKQFLVIALLVAIAGGGGYAWYSNAPVNDVSGDKVGVSRSDSTTPTTAPQKKTPGLTEEDVQSVIAEAHDKSGSVPQETPIGLKEQSCEDLPQVPWWSNASHESITAYVENKTGGDWVAYLAKWDRQLKKLEAIHAKGGTVIAPKLGTRLTGSALAEYIAQVEKRIEVTRCLAIEAELQ